MPEDDMRIRHGAQYRFAGLEGQQVRHEVTLILTGASIEGQLTFRADSLSGVATVRIGLADFREAVRAGIWESL